MVREVVNNGRLRLVLTRKGGVRCQRRVLGFWSPVFFAGPGLVGELFTALAGAHNRVQALKHLVREVAPAVNRKTLQKFPELVQLAFRQVTQAEPLPTVETEAGTS